MMSSSLISKVEKASRYSQEKGRVSFSSFTVNFKGDHNAYTVKFTAEDRWSCTCGFFARHEVCSHTMALQKMLDGMMPEKATAESV